MTLKSRNHAASQFDPQQRERAKHSAIERLAWSFTGIGVVGLAFIGVALAEGTGVRPPPPTVPASALGTFAGYEWFGAAQTVSAEWRVPRITRLNSSDASTWIGVQSPSGGFIQVGITEDSDPKLDILNGGLAMDQGFWSDDTVEFHPQFVDAMSNLDQHVRAGDRVSAAITKVVGGWQLRLHDFRSDLSFDQRIAMTTSDFNEVEWFQEDPTDSGTNEPLPYPRLGSVAFSSLEVNGNYPVLRLENAVWMSVPNRDFRVTALRNDAFQVVPAHFDQAQAKFLTVSAPYQDATRRFDDVESTWRAHPPTSTAALKALRPFAKAERRYNQALVSQQWQGVSSAEITALITANRLDVAALVALARDEPDAKRTVVSQLTAAHDQKGDANRDIRSALQLPG